MATGDQLDFETRIVSTLPPSWFTGDTPVLDALISGMAWGLAYIYSLFAYVRQQTRIATATEGFLDLIAADFFGAALVRKANEGDGAYRSRILANLFQERGTRAGMIRVLTILTGRPPKIFEPMRPADTGGYGAGCGWGVAGGWGSSQLPAQAFIQAYRPTGSGIPNIAGWGVPTGGYGVGQSEWTSPSMIQGAVTDDDIYDAVDRTKLAGTTVWVNISS